MLSPHMVRVVVTGDDLLGWPEDRAGGNVKLAFADDGWSQAQLQTAIEAGPRPVVRTYTARSYDATTNELSIDFVIHGDHGIASKWARSAKPGDFVAVLGPSPAKLTTTDADWYLVCADMSAMPAAEATLERLPASSCGQIIFEVMSDEDRRTISYPSGFELTWLVHEHPSKPSRQQIQFARSIVWPTGRVSAFVAGEASVVKEFRPWLLNEMGLDKKDIYVSGYWKIGLIEDEHQAEKRAS